jgi:hypothetical protein
MIEQPTAEMLEVAESIYDGWYADEPRIDWEDFFDRMEDGSDIDLGDDMLSPTIKAIQKHIRAYRKL